MKYMKGSQQHLSSRLWFSQVGPRKAVGSDEAFVKEAGAKIAGLRFGM